MERMLSMLCLVYCKIQNALYFALNNKSCCMEFIERRLLYYEADIHAVDDEGNDALLSC